jgi:nucleoside-diphosphate-sugar epimerase
MKVVVTGGSGRIGGYVVKELAQAGYEVLVFDRTPPPARVAGVIYRLGDHENLGELVEVCFGAQAIVHLSAIPEPRTYPNPTVYRTNVMGTFNAHEAAVLTNIPLVISTSSQSAYGFAWQHRPFFPLYLPMDEQHPDLAQDTYGLSKMAGEQLAHGFHRRCDLRVCVLRPPFVVFPEDDKDLLRAVLDAPQAWADHMFSYVDVRDLAVAYRLVLEAPAAIIQDEVFNVAADDALATTPLAELLPRLDPVFNQLASGLTGAQPMVSAARLKERLGWCPQFSWRDMITLENS